MAAVKEVLILGTTAYAEMFMDMFRDPERIKFAGFVENLDRSKCNKTIAGLPVYWSDDIQKYLDLKNFICVLGTTLRKSWIVQFEKYDRDFISLIHPSCVLSELTSVGVGVSVDAGSVIAGFSTIGDHARIGRNASIGHHTTIGSFSTIHPGSIVSGRCDIHSQVTVGTGAIIMDGITIGSGAVISAGAVVSRNVAENSLVAGNPCRVVRENYGPR